MKNWLDNSIPWKVSSLVLERGALFLLIGFSVFLGGSRALGLQEALLMLFFIPVIAWIVYRLETNTPTLRHWAHIMIFSMIALLVINSLIHLSKITSGISWNPFPTLVTMQLLMAVMVFERYYHSMILEVTMMSLLLLLMGIGKTATGALLGILLAMVILCYLRFSFAVSQWARTVNREKGLWQAPAASVSYRQIFSVVGEGMLIFLIGLGIGFLMVAADWKISSPKFLLEMIQQNIPIDVRGFGSTLSKEEKEADPPPAPTHPAQPEEIPLYRIWREVLMLLLVIFIVLLLLTALGILIFFWRYRVRTRKRWLKLRVENPRDFLKEWLSYLRYFLEKFGRADDLFLSPAEYIEGILKGLQISIQDIAAIKRTFLKGWYSSSPVEENDLKVTAEVYQQILKSLKKQGTWLQRLQYHCLKIQW